MSLGETIYRLRTEKSLSQGDLAELLEVSRQSISKWENNSAVPDLEKIIKLSEIFGVTLDELVKGEESSQKTVYGAAAQREISQAGVPARKIAGTILLCMAFFVAMIFALAGAGLGGLIFALPFLTCGILCFALKKNVGLWCAWAVYVLVDIFMAYATGISRASVWHSFQWTRQMNYGRLMFAWFSVLGLVALITVTVMRFGKTPFASVQRGRNKLITAWAVVVAIQAAAMLWGYTGFYKYLREDIVEMGFVFRLISILFSWAKIIAVTVALVVTVRFVKMIRQKGREE